MIKIICYLFCCCVMVAGSKAQTIDKTAAAIPEALKKNAAAVYRLDKGWLDISSASEYTLTVHQVIAILNEEGKHYLHHQFGFDKFHKVEDVDIQLYDAKGMLQKKYSKKDFETEAAYDGISLVTDDKVMSLYTPPPGYPCTVEVQYQLKISGYIELPNWYINTSDAGTELFRYEVTVPAEIDIRHRTLNMNAIPAIETLEKKKKYVWEIKNISAKKTETDGYEAAKYLPQVEVAPNEFSYDGYRGSFKTWSEFGAWNHKLYEEKKPFSPERIVEIKAMITGAKSREEKIAVLYSYLQRNMRYVSIQLGIGGFKPFAVQFVDEKKYGDCKALTNYMRHLLQVAGIPSYPALINAGNNKIPVDPQFPADPFNHVILCVPGQADTTWLECTSNTSKAGHLGGFTENKKALLITEQGGVLVNTPKSLYKSNRVVINNEVVVDANGGGHVTSKIIGSGEPASTLQYVNQLKDDEQKEMLMNYLRYKNPDEFSVSSVKDNAAALQVNRGYSKLYEFSAGSKYFFSSSVNRLANGSMKVAQRETDFMFSYPYEKTDTTVFLLPAVFTPESLPAARQFTTEHSIYKRSFVHDKTTNRLIVVSYIVLKDHVIPATGYAKMVQFFKDVALAEEESMVFVRSKDAGF